MFASTVLSDEEYEELTKRYWASRVAGCDEITVIVRRNDRVLRTVIIEPQESVTPSCVPEPHAE
jgi:hypothetical protein